MLTPMQIWVLYYAQALGMLLHPRHDLLLHAVLERAAKIADAALTQTCKTWNIEHGDLHEHLD